MSVQQEVGLSEGMSQLAEAIFTSLVRSSVCLPASAMGVCGWVGGCKHEGGRTTCKHD